MKFLKEYDERAYISWRYNVLHCKTSSPPYCWVNKERLLKDSKYFWRSADFEQIIVEIFALWLTREGTRYWNNVGFYMSDCERYLEGE